jgi:hypothetical protein
MYLLKLILYQVDVQNINLAYLFNFNINFAYLFNFNINLGYLFYFDIKLISINTIILYINKQTRHMT